MDTNFPRCMKAGFRADQNLWELADALLREADNKYTGPRGLNAVATEFAKIGMEYTAPYLSMLRSTAEAFPPGKRFDKVSVRTHGEAGSYENLKAVVAAGRKEGREISLHYVEKILGQLRAQARKEREQERKHAEVALAQAQAEERQAIKRRDNATSKEDREHASQQRDAARERKHQAREKVKNIRIAPRKREIVVDDQQPALLRNMQIAADISRIFSTLKRLYTEIEPVMEAGELSATTINLAIEELLESRSEIDRLLTLLRKGQKGTHLYAVS